MVQIRFPPGLRSSGPIAVFKGPTSKGREGKEKRKGMERNVKGRGEEVEGGIWPTQNFWCGAPCIIEGVNHFVRGVNLPPTNTAIHAHIFFLHLAPTSF